MGESIKNTDEFLSKFELEGTPYFSVQPLSGTAIGFLVRREYPERYRYVAPRNESGQPQFVALLRLSYDAPETGMANVCPCRSPIEANAFIAPREGDTISLKRRRDKREPVDLVFHDEYFYDHANEMVIDATGHALSGRQLLDEIYKAHCDTARYLRGARFRLKLRARSFAVWSLGAISWAIGLLVRGFLGRAIKRPAPSTDAFWRGDIEVGAPSLQAPDTGEAKLEITSGIKIFDYQAPIQLIVSFCGLVLACYGMCFLWLDRTSRLLSFLRGIAKSPVLSGALGIVVLFVMDQIMPKLAERAINRLNRARQSAMSHSIKCN